MCSSVDASTISHRVSIIPCEASGRPGFRVSQCWLGSERLIALEIPHPPPLSTLGEGVCVLRAVRISQVSEPTHLPQSTAQQSLAMETHV